MPSPDLLEALEIETCAVARGAVIWLHGLGADGYDFVDIVPMLRLLEAIADPLRVPARADAAGHDQRRRGDAGVVRRRAAMRACGARTRRACASRSSRSRR